MWSNAGARAYGEGIHKTFMDICEEKGLSDWDGWAELITMPKIADKPDKLIRAAQGFVSGREVLTGKLLTATMNEYGVCPARIGLEEWAGRELPELKKLCLDAIES